MLVGVQTFQVEEIPQMEQLASDLESTGFSVDLDLTDCTLRWYLNFK